MKGFNQYFRQHLKDSRRRLICILVILLALTAAIAVGVEPDYLVNFHTGVPYCHFVTLNTAVAFLGILSYVLPIMEFSFFKKRINLDCAYALPVSRRAMAAVHYLTGLIVLWLAFTLSHLFNLALLLSRGLSGISPRGIIVHYFFCLLFGFAIYSLMVFIFNEANTKGDGIWFMLAYTYVPWAMVGSIKNAINMYRSMHMINKKLSFDFSTVIPWNLFIELTNSGRSTNLFTSEREIIISTFWIIAGIASVIGLFFTFGKKRTEKTEEISDSFFGFRTLIPVYAICAIISVNPSNNTVGLASFVIIEVLAFIAYTIYRRGFHYKKSDVAVLCSLFLVWFIVTAI